MELAEILKGETAKTEPIPEPKAEVTAEPETKPVDRDEKGRFAKGEKSEEPAEKAEPQAEPPSAKDEQEPQDPVARGFYVRAREERKKRQELKAQYEALQAQIAQQQLAQRMPDPVRQPDEYRSFEMQRLQQEVTNKHLWNSQRLAEKQYSAEEVEEAQEVFKQSAAQMPQLWDQLYAQEHPYGWLMEQMRQYKLLQEIGGDPNAYKEKLKAELRKELENQQKTQPNAPPQSLAGLGSGAVNNAPWSGPPSLNSILKR